MVDNLDVTKRSVSFDTKRLEENGLNTTDLAGMLVLLPPGLEIAKQMYARFMLFSKLLIGLDVSPETAKDDTCKIEHDLSEESFAAIRKHTNAYR